VTPLLLAALSSHLTQQEFESSFLMSKELTIPTTWSECNKSLASLQPRALPMMQTPEQSLLAALC
jgi:hypothetical protein